jgi:hypothetical protein
MRFFGKDDPKPTLTIKLYLCPQHLDYCSTVKRDVKTSKIKSSSLVPAKTITTLRLIEHCRKCKVVYEQ